MAEIALGLIFIVMGMGLLGLTAFSAKELFRDFDGLNLFSFSLLLLTILFIVGLFYDAGRISNAEVQIDTAVVEVVNKSYASARTHLISTGKTSVPVNVQAKHLIRFSDGDYEQVVDNYSLYEELSLGDRLEAERTLYLDSNGEVFDVSYGFKHD